VFVVFEAAHGGFYDIRGQPPGRFIGHAQRAGLHRGGPVVQRSKQA
jgi:hypothetical protein